MEFQIGQLWVKVSTQKWVMVIVPIGRHMLAAKLELFDSEPSKSVNLDIDVYEKNDVAAADKVQRSMRE